MTIFLIVEIALYTTIVLFGFALVTFKDKKNRTLPIKGINMISSVLYLYLLFVLLLVNILSVNKSTKEFTNTYPDETNPATFSDKYFKDYAYLKESNEIRITLLKGIVFLCEIFFLVNVVLVEILAFFKQGKPFEIKMVNMSSLTASQTESKRQARTSMLQKRKSKKSTDNINNTTNKSNNKTPQTSSYRLIPSNSKEITNTSNWTAKLEVNFVFNTVFLFGIFAVYLAIFIAYLIHSKHNHTALNVVDLFLPFKMANFVILCLVLALLLFCSFYYTAVKNNNLTFYHSEYYVMVSVDLIVIFFVFFSAYAYFFPDMFLFMFGMEKTRNLKFTADEHNYFDIIYEGMSFGQFVLFRGVIYILFSGIVKILPYLLDINKERIGKQSIK